MIALIAAVANGNVIGYKGQMPWGRLPGDLERFKALTMDHPVALGSNTFDSIDRILKGRRMIVLTNHPEKFASFRGAITTIQNIDFVLELAQETCVYIAGGENVYRQFMNLADIAYITRIHADFEGDAFFPMFTTPDWSNLNSVDESDGGYKTSYELWVRGNTRKPPVIPEELFGGARVRPHYEFITGHG